MNRKVTKQLKLAADKLALSTMGTDNEITPRRAYRLFKRRYKEFKRAGR